MDGTLPPAVIRFIIVGARVKEINIRMTMITREVKSFLTYLKSPLAAKTANIKPPIIIDEFIDPIPWSKLVRMAIRRTAAGPKINGSRCPQ